MEVQTTPSKVILYTSYALQGLVSLMFLMGAGSNLMQTETAINGAIDLGYPTESVFYLGVILLLATILYIVPKTTILGAGFLTAWLGGAVATHIIHGDSTAFTMFPVVIGILLWLSIWLRNEKLKAIFPIA